MDDRNITILAGKPSVASELLSELRKQSFGGSRANRRSIVRKLGIILAYEVSKSLAFKESTVKTPLSDAVVDKLESQPVIATVLRAGLPLQEGFLKVFCEAEAAFVSAYRRHHDDSFSIQLDAVSCPSLDNKTLIIVDTMLATGQSLLSAIASLKQFGEPKEILIASVIASREGVRQIQQALPEAKIWSVAVDSELNQEKYIVPGIGDAGDLMYGPKEQS